MKLVGRIHHWNDEKGYGFLESADKQPAVFVHINAFPHRSRRPVVGDRISYNLSHDNQGRPKATNISYYGEKSQSSKSRTLRGRLGPLMLGCIFLFALVSASYFQLIPYLVPILGLILTTISYLLYRSDKLAAERGSWRIPESTLHLIDVLGGWPGGFIAQKLLRHKTLKQPFRFIFLLTVIINVAAVTYFVVSSRVMR